ncbi:MAG: electron transport complex subunit RsxC [Defluviitaleaceae bacterium]|nr:electron transport complex subunit RsxC [Defluviitaleaceae bacterium]
MRIASMRRGIHPPECKETALIPIKYFYPRNGASMVYPMVQHIGAPCEPIVKVGDSVKVGQKVGDSEAYVSSPIHTTVSGTVTDIRTVITPTGKRCAAVVIENDGKYQDHPTCNQSIDYKTLPREAILAHIRECGIVGMGGAGFPTHVKLNPPPGKDIDTVIVNAAECEPYLTNDHRVMLEEPKRIIPGIEILLHLFPEARCIIAIEDNKRDAIELLRKMTDSPKITVVPMKTKYPQGAEKQLVHTCLKREIPGGGLPMDVKCIVQNVDTVISLHRAFFRGRPLMRKIMTIAGGAVRNPGNYKVRFGMSYRDIIEAIGGLLCEPYKVIIGGPMMGVSHYTLDIPVIKTSSAFLLFTEKECKVPPERDCFRCGKCVEHCPVGLMPLELDKFAVADQIERFTAFNGMDCIECGCCAYVCPAKRHLTQSISTVRRELLQNR